MESKLKRQLSWLEHEFPELHPRKSDSGDFLLLDGPTGTVKVPLLKRQRGSSLEEPRSYLNTSSGLLVVRDGGCFVHVRVPRDKGRRLTPHQLGLLATLIESSRDGEYLFLAERVRDLREFFLTILGVELQEMAIRRFLEAIRGLFSPIPGEDGFLLIERTKAIKELRAQVSVRTLGSPHRFAVRDYGEVIEVVRHVGAPAIHGVSHFLRSLGGVPAEDDIILSQDALPELGQRLGQPVSPSYGGATLLVRVPAHVQVSVLAGRAGRRSVNPFLAHAAALTMNGREQEVAESWDEGVHED